MKVRIPVVVPETPTWACTFGVDKYGLFAGLCIEDVVQIMRWIEPGTFEMGSPENEPGRYEDEGPQHTVTIQQGFWISDTPVTQALYQAVTGDNPSHFKGDNERPVEEVSWNDAMAFFDKLNGLLSEHEESEASLPAEAQWEYACRAGTKQGLYSGLEITSEEGTCANVDALAWYGKNSEDTTHVVKTKVPNPWGLYDMLGNVWEWCQDGWHGNYGGAPSDGSAWVDEEGGGRVFRGGSFNGGARNCRCACRGNWHPDSRDHLQGFRLVLAHRSIGTLEQADGERLGR